MFKKMEYAPGKLLVGSVGLIIFGYLAAIFFSNIYYLVILFGVGVYGLTLAFKDIRRGRH